MGLGLHYSFFLSREGLGGGRVGDSLRALLDFLKIKTLYAINCCRQEQVGEVSAH